MKQLTTRKLVFAALFAALTCACTMAVTIPTPTGGYVHAGDCFVLLAGACLGPIVGGLAAGIGSALSDLILGYFIYVPATFLIKFLASAAFALLFRSFIRPAYSHKKNDLIFGILGLAPAVVIIVGYFFFEWLLTDNALTAALSGILGNALQGLVSILLSTFFFTVLPKNIFYKL